MGPIFFTVDLRHNYTLQCKRLIKNANNGREYVNQNKALSLQETVNKTKY